MEGGKKQQQKQPKPSRSRCKTKLLQGTTTLLFPFTIWTITLFLFYQHISACPHWCYFHRSGWILKKKKTKKTPEPAKKITSVRLGVELHNIVRWWSQPSGNIRRTVRTKSLKWWEENKHNWATKPLWWKPHVRCSTSLQGLTDLHQNGALVQWEKGWRSPGRTVPRVYHHNAV